MAAVGEVLVTGAAGFIGFHVSRELLARGTKVVGLDSLNEYYDVDLKRARVSMLQDHSGFAFLKGDVADRGFMEEQFAKHRFTHVVHLAAQAGVRYSLVSPESYIESNLVGFGVLLEECRKHKVQHLLYASSSSVYGLNRRRPFSPRHGVDHPVSLYAATKRSNELMAHAYSHLFDIPATGLRFFTVYGPWGRPDMALFKFTKAILAGEEIDVNNRGDMERDLTYIDDAVECVVRLLETAPTRCEESRLDNPSSTSAPWRIVNVGSGRTIPLMDLIGALEGVLGSEAKKRLLPMQPGDVRATLAETDGLQALIGFTPNTSVQEGVERFVRWYFEYYGIERSPEHDRPVP